MAEGSEDSYLYMKGHSKALYECTNSEIFPGKMPSSYVPKQASTNTKSLPTSNVRPQSLSPEVGHSSHSTVPASPSSHDDCMAFDLYEQDPDTDFQCDDYNLRRQSSDFRFNFEDMIVLPMRLKKPFTPVTSDTPPSTEVDEFDYADQHVYYSQLITTVNSNSAVHEYGTRKGPLWDCAWEILVPKGLHPSYLTEGEFVKLVLSQGNDTTRWMDIHIPILHRRALQKVAAARQKLTNAGISPFELTQEYLEAFEWMDKIEQDNFVKTMQKLQLQVAFQKQGLSMRIEDIDDIAPKDEEELIGKSHTKLVDGFCIPADYPSDSDSDSDESYMAEEITLEEFGNQFPGDNSKKAPASFHGTPIQNTDQSPSDDNEAFIAKCLGALMGVSSTATDPSKQIFEHKKNRQVLEESIDAHQANQIPENPRSRLAQFTPHEASSPGTHNSCHDPPKDPNTRVVFSLQDPPPLSPTRSAPPASVSHPSDSSSSYGCSLDGSSGSGSGTRMTKSKSNGGQSQISSKTEASGMSGMSGTSARIGSISRKLGESPKSLKKKLSSVFGTIGRSGKRNAA